jgi:uncharacterized protein with FMN-binding domain
MRTAVGENGRRMRTARVVILLICLVVVPMCTTQGKIEEKRSLPEIRNIDFRTLRDGEYEGYYNYSNMADAKVHVTVVGGRVTSIQLLKHFHFPFISGAKVVERIIQDQSLDVDAVTGATGSSIVIKKAVELALQRGFLPGCPLQ